ncbi:MAG: hypothetical protein L0H64_06495 [Pseudonocardia sp.]|nr:hypothetical protein [Pseudonocardia sp.]
MTSPQDLGQDDLDRVVSRRVDNPTAADPGDEGAYTAADPSTDTGADTDRGGDGTASERAARDLDGDDGSEPTRSE